jgi:benzoyl-CoA reductase subunit B
MKEVKKYPTRPLESWAKMKELRSDHFWHTWQAHDKGELVVMGQPTLDAILSGFGNVATPAYDPNFNRVLLDPNRITHYQETMDVKGYGDGLCVAMRMQLGAMFEDKNITSPEGKVVKPDFIFQWHLCHPLAKVAQIAGEYMGVPYFLVDSPPRNAPGWKEWFVAQMQNFIEWAEKITGRKYDDEKLVEATKNEWEMMVTFARMNEFTQAIPTPLDGRHMQSLRMPTVTYRFKKEGVAYAHMLYDEVKQRVADGISARGYEGMRLFGGAVGGRGEGGRGFNEKYGVVSVPGPALAFSAWTTKDDGTWYVPTTPKERGIEIRTREDALGAEAELWLGGGRVDNAHMIIENIMPKAAVKEVEQWHIDAVIMGVEPSTEAACGAGALERYLALKEAGVPILFLEGAGGFMGRVPTVAENNRRREQVTVFFESLGMSGAEMEESW